MQQTDSEHSSGSFHMAWLSLSVLPGLFNYGTAGSLEAKKYGKLNCQNLLITGLLHPLEVQNELQFPPTYQKSWHSSTTTSANHATLF